MTNKQFVSTAIMSAMIFISCNSTESKNEHEGHNMKDSTQQSAVVDTTSVKTFAVIYTDVDATAAASIKLIVDHYLHIKNALVNVYGSGYSYISVSDRLVTKIFGSGNVLTSVYPERL